MKKFQLHILSFILFALSGAAVLWMLPSTHPEGGVNLPLDRTAILQWAQTLADSLGVDTEQMEVKANLKRNRALLKSVQMEQGIAKSNHTIRTSLPVYFWEMTWREEKKEISILRDSGEDDAKQARETLDALRGDVTMQLTPAGKLLGFQRKIIDSASLSGLGAATARLTADAFLHRFTAYCPAPGRHFPAPDSGHQGLPPAIDAGSCMDTLTFESEQKNERASRTDYVFIWSTSPSALHEKDTVSVTLTGNIVSRFSIEHKVPAVAKVSTTPGFYEVVIIVLLVGLVVAMLIVAFKRIRAYEIGFKTSIGVGAAVAVSYAIVLMISLDEALGWEVLITALLIPILYGGLIVILWAVGESIARESWREKFVAYDLLHNGHLFHSRVGESISRGIALGSAALAISLLLIGIADRFFPLWVSFDNETGIAVFDAFSPTLAAFTGAFHSSVFAFIVFILFVTSIFKRWVSSPLLVGLLATLVLGLLTDIHPVFIGIPIRVIVAGVFIWALYRFDVITSLVTMLTFNILYESAPLYLSGHAAYVESAFIVVGILGMLIVLYSLTAFRKGEITDFTSITPAFVKNITERERLQNELEVARRVQMTLLPKREPVIPHLDIASRCLPALEVGGDYYDFIEMKGNRLGVAIGDVSGKGTQAAFFMTLTKGFLRALTGSSHSPSTVLTQVNKLFCENVERGTFTSMVYAVFDTDHCTLTIARAGHNPVILRKAQAKNAETIKQSGLALGLDSGPTFERSINDVEVTFQPGDLFIFYTDGFNEAMNKTKEEFGDDRLLAVIEKYGNAGSKEILDGIFSEMKGFIGGAPQHDDMTMVIIKIT